MPSHLGIDVGTTSVKVCVVRDGVKVRSLKVVHEAHTKPKEDHPRAALFDEQDPKVLITVLDSCMNQLKHSFKKVSEILVTGQMHGILLWKRKSYPKITSMNIVSLFDALVAETTNLITWQDRRCNTNFLNQFPPSPPFCKISSGFGIASLAWLQSEYKIIDKYDMCGTIMDLLVWLLTEGEYVTMTSHNANSWGYYDMEKDNWHGEKLRSLNIDVNFLPKIVPIDKHVGNLKWPLYGISTGAVVYPALGDMQCSICASKPFNNEAVVHIGTSSQLSYITKYQSDAMRGMIKKHPGISIVPYKGDDVIISAASLSGGNVVHQFAMNLQSWMRELGCINIPTKEELFKKLEQAAYMYQENVNNVESLHVVPRLFGERFDPDSSGTVSNISPSNCSIGSITCSLYEGIIRNMSEMLPVEVLKQYGANGVCATGGALVDNGVLIELVMEIYDLTFRVGHDDDGSFGAAIFLEDLRGRKT